MVELNKYGTGMITKQDKIIVKMVVTKVRNTKKLGRLKLD